MKKISRRNFLLASGAVTIGAALAACGGSSASTSTASSAPASSAAASGTSAAGKVLIINSIELWFLNAKGELFVNKTPIYVLPRKNICYFDYIYSYGAFLFYFLPSGTFKTGVHPFPFPYPFS